MGVSDISPKLPKLEFKPATPELPSLLEEAEKLVEETASPQKLPTSSVVLLPDDTSSESGSGESSLASEKDVIARKIDAEAESYPSPLPQLAEVVDISEDTTEISEIE